MPISAVERISGNAAIRSDIATLEATLNQVEFQYGSLNLVVESDSVLKVTMGPLETRLSVETATALAALLSELYPEVE